MCRKRRKHFQSFCRNGIMIRVHDFVYVLVEEDRRLVAYLEDMYEDSKGNKMVVVRWFHKTDEVDFPLPHHFNDREIFFSLCLQDLSIECIDGVAVVLSPQHYEKYLGDSRSTPLQPYLCRKQFDNDEVKPFDITQIKGYWKQEILRYMTLPSLMADVTPEQSDGADVKENDGDSAKKRHRPNNNDFKHNSKTFKKGASHHLQSLGSSIVHFKGRSEVSSHSGGLPARFLARKETKQSSPFHLTVGSQVEVLSQDSGIRGCWFRAIIMKICKDKIKVQYLDLTDADDESTKLVEWISASKLAAPDHFGLRVWQRSIIRPLPQPNKGKTDSFLGIGSVVDVWWHDGWWEGIVVQRQSKDKLQVHFPAEMKDSTFGLSDLRHSQEWLRNGWIDMKKRPDLVSTLSSLVKQKVKAEDSGDKSTELVISDTRQSIKDESKHPHSCLVFGYNERKEYYVVPDLSKDHLLTKLKWSLTRKRSTINTISFHKPHFNVKRRRNIFWSRTKETYFISTPLKIDHENCKQIEDFRLCSQL